MSITNLGDITNDAVMFSPEQVLRTTLENDIGKQRAFKHAKKLIVIAVDKENDTYDVSYNQAGMSCSEILALLEVTKTIVLQQMGFIGV